MKVEAGGGAGWLGGVAEKARRQEALGYDGITFADFDHEIVTQWTLAAAATERVELGTSVMIAFARSPFVAAQTAWDLHEFTGGRINIGLGPQVKGHNERRFASGPWSPPAPRIEEYVKAMRAAWATFQTGAAPDFVGQHYQFTLCPPRFNPGPIPFAAPKVFLATVGAAMARAAGRTCDGVRIHPFCTDRYVREVVIPNVRVGAQQAGRDLAGFELAGGGMMALGETESEAEQAAQGLRGMVSFYGSTRSYHPVLRVHGHEDEGMRLREMSLRGEWEAMERTLPEDVLRDIVTVSTYDKLPDLLRQRPYLARTSLAYGGGEGAAGDERLRWLIQQVQQVETTGIGGD